jgi:hypothetical protein
MAQDSGMNVLGKDVTDLELSWAGIGATGGWRLKVTTDEGTTIVRATAEISRLWSHSRPNEDERRRLILDLLEHLPAADARHPYMLYYPEVLYRAVENAVMPPRADPRSPLATPTHGSVVPPHTSLPKTLGEVA